MKYLKQINELAKQYTEQDISIDKYDAAAYKLAIDYAHKGRLSKDLLFSLGIVAGQAWCMAQTSRRFEV